MSSEAERERSIAAAEPNGHAGSAEQGSSSRLGWMSWLVITMAMFVLLIAAWASFTPIASASREEIFEIPKGTWASRMAGNQVEILPDEIRLTLGINDVLVLRNLDEVPQIFGPTLMMPGQSFRLPFTMASSYDFACTAHASGQMTITVDPFPDTPWSRLRWRLMHWSSGTEKSIDAASRAGDADSLPSL